MSDELSKEEVTSVIMREPAPACLDKWARAKIIDIMSVPIKETSTKEYYIANDRRLKRKLMERGR